MLRFLILFLFLIPLSNAGELPEFLESSLQESYRIFLDYSKRAPSEIVQSSLVEKDNELFLQLEQINGFSFMFNRDEVNIYKQKIVLMIADTFSIDQVRSIISLSDNQEIDRKEAKRYFQEALGYQKNLKLNVKAIKRL